VSGTNQYNLRLEIDGGAVPPDRGRRPRRPLQRENQEPDRGSGADAGVRPTRDFLTLHQECNRPVVDQFYVHMCLENSCFGE